MKRLLFLLMFVPVGLFAQHTISDYGDVFTLNRSSDTVVIVKDNVVSIYVDGAGVSIETNARQANPRKVESYRLGTVAYGYSNNFTFLRFLRSMVKSNYSVVLNNATNPDSIFGKIGTDTLWVQVLTYGNTTSDTVTTYGPKIAW